MRLFDGLNQHSHRLFNKKRELLPKPQPQYNFTDEVEGILIGIGKHDQTSRSAVAGSLKMLDELARLDRPALLNAIAAHLLYDPDPIRNHLFMSGGVLPRYFSSSDQETVTITGAAVACVYLKATELVREVSKAMRLHPEQSESLGTALNWLLEQGSTETSQTRLPFTCLQA